MDIMEWTLPQENVVPVVHSCPYSYSWSPRHFFPLRVLPAVKVNTKKDIILVLKPLLSMGMKLSLSRWTFRELLREIKVLEKGKEVRRWLYLPEMDFLDLWGSHYVPVVWSFGVWLTIFMHRNGAGCYWKMLKLLQKSHFVNSRIYLCSTETAFQKSLWGEKSPHILPRAGS